MSTRIEIAGGAHRPAALTLVVDKLAPRLISRTPTAAHIGVTAAEMLLLDGDRVDVSVRVGRGCRLRIDDIGGTVAYPRRGGARESGGSPVGPSGSPVAEWNVDITVEDGGTLEWRGLPFVVATGADVARRTSVRLGEDARLLLRETLVLGRHGEAGGRITSALAIDDCHGPILVEETALDGAAPVPGVLAGARVLDSVVAAGFRPETRPGDLVMDEPGAIARYIGRDTHASGLEERFESWRSDL